MNNTDSFSDLFAVLAQGSEDISHLDGYGDLFAIGILPQEFWP